MNYRTRAEQLLQEAIKDHAGRRAEGYRDDKVYVMMEDFTALIGAGGRVFELNLPIIHSYHNRIEYQGHTFIHASDEPIAFVINSQLVGDCVSAIDELTSANV